MRRGRTCAHIEGNPNSNCCGRVHESIIKSFRKVASIVAQRVNLSTTLPLNSDVKSFGSRSTMGTLFCLLLYVAYNVCAGRNFPNDLFDSHFLELCIFDLSSLPFICFGPSLRKESLSCKNLNGYVHKRLNCHH